MKRKFDTVKMMRGIRSNLAEKYTKTPELEDKELEEIRKRYHLKIKKDSVVHPAIPTSPSL